MTRSDTDARELDSVVTDLRLTVDYLESCGVLSRVIELLRSAIDDAVENGSYKDLRSANKELKQWVRTLPRTKQAELASKLEEVSDSSMPYLVQTSLVRGGIASEDEYYAVKDILSDLVALDAASPSRVILEKIALEYETAGS